jgi:hypothetical protein
MEAMMIQNSVVLPRKVNLANTNPAMELVKSTIRVPETVTITLFLNQLKKGALVNTVT